MSVSDLVGPVVVHADGSIHYANEEFCALVGVDAPSEVVQTPLGEFVAPQYRERLAEQVEQVRREDTPTLGLRLELDRADGTRCTAIAVSSIVEWEGEPRIHTSFVAISGTDERTALSLRENAMHEAPVGITIADATREDEPLVYVNDAFVELTGYPREEIIGRNCRFLQGEATREEPVAEMRAAIDAETPVTVELRNYRKDGSLFWNRVTISPVEDEHGEVTHFLGFQEDISDAKVYERERALFEKHAEASDQVMFVTDREGTIEYVNPAFERVTGYSAAEAVGKNPRILNSGQQEESFYEELWETITAGDVWEAELTNRTKSGELYRVHQTIVPITDDRGEVTHFTTIERDITDERLTRQVLDVLDRVLRHNVRTSVNVIDGYAECLEGDLDDAKQRAAVRSIRDRTTAMRKISEQLTAIRNLVEGHREPSPLDLQHVGTIVDRFAETYDDAVVTATIHADEDDAIKNGSVFEVALETAIENAVTHADREPPRVEITVTASDDMASIEIADNGPGIPDSEWEIIKAGVETPLQHTSGIGLWILYWSVTAMGGTVERTTNEPRGTVLTLEIPLLRETT